MNKIMKSFKKNNVSRSVLIDITIGFLLASLCLVLMSMGGYAQNVGINNTTPHTKSLLDLTSTDKGLLIPRMTQLQRTNMFPVSDASARGMLVYQTDFKTGFYYYDGLIWNFFSKGNTSWETTGNGGTNPAINFLGTTDNQPLVIQSNNMEVVRITPNEKVGIGTSNPAQNLSSAKVEISDDNGSNSDLLLTTGGGAPVTKGYPQIVFHKTRGTIAAPLKAEAFDFSGVVVGRAFDGSGFANTSAMIFGIDSAVTTGSIRGNIQFHTTGGAQFEKMRITKDGNVGIGEITPVAKLDVKGNANIVLDSNYRIGNIRVLSAKGQANFFAGRFAGINNVTGANNTYVGDSSGYFGVSSSSNTAVGRNSLLKNISHWNTAVGSHTLANNINGFSNSAFGVSAMSKNISGFRNTAIGGGSLENDSTGFQNVAVGYYSLYFNKTGNNNASIGTYSLYNNLADNNCAFGHNSGLNNTNGIANVFIGFESGYNNTIGANNSFIGYRAGYNNTSGNYNVAIGNNTQIGSNLTNAIAIGNNASAVSSNTMILGGTGSDAVNVGVGTNTPNAKTEVYSNSYTGFPNLRLTESEDDFSRLGMYNISSTKYWEIAAKQNSNDNLSFFNIFNSSTGNLLTIKGNGNVGLGTNDPVYIAHVASDWFPALGVQAKLATGYSGAHFLSNTGALMAHFGYGNISCPSFSNQVYAGSIAAVPFLLTTQSIERMRITETGNIGIGTGTPSTKLEINGFTKLGTDAPAIKIKKLTGVTSSMQGSSVSIAHGLSVAKIISVQVLVEKTATLLLPPGNNTISGDEFQFQVTTSQVSVTNKSGNSANILSKPIRIVITYEE